MLDGTDEGNRTGRERSTKYILPWVLDSMGFVSFHQESSYGSVSREVRVERVRYWQGLIEEHSRSGLSVLEFVKNARLHYIVLSMAH